MPITFEIVTDESALRRRFRMVEVREERCDSSETRMKSLASHEILLQIKYVSLIIVFDFDLVC